MFFLWICNSMLGSYWGRNILFGFFTLVWGFFISMDLYWGNTDFTVKDEATGFWGIVVIFIITVICLILNNVIEHYESERAYKEWMREEKKKSQMTVGERAIYEELKELNDSVNNLEWI